MQADKTDKTELIKEKNPPDKPTYSPDTQKCIKKLQERQRNAVQEYRWHKEALLADRRNKIIEIRYKIKRVRQIQNPERDYRYKANNWFYKIINTDYEINDKTRAKRIKENLTKKRNRCLPMILDYFVLDALSYNKSKKIAHEIGKTKVKMVAMKDKKLETVFRLPVFLKPDYSLLAKALEISESQVYKYIQTIVNAGLVQRAGKEKTHRPKAGYLILGGYIEPGTFSYKEASTDKNKKDEWKQSSYAPQQVYFWGSSQPDIQKCFENFKRID